MISIIIPVYNVEQYIEDCLKTLVLQTYKNFEVIFVDDGSKDLSSTRILSYLKDKPIRYKLIKQKNQGVSAARNRGIAESKGEYLCFIDSDDMLEKRYLEVLHKNLLDKKADLSFIRKKDISEFTHNFSTKSHYEKIAVYERKEALNRLLESKIKVGIWGLLCKKEFFQHIRFAVGYSYSEDLEIVWKLVALSTTIVESNLQLYGYRLRVGSAMSMVNSKRMQGLVLFNRLETFIAENVPEFSEQFNKYGVPKWLWSTLWQEALASKNYSNFSESIKKYGDLREIKNLLSFPVKKVSFTSWLFCLSPRLFYYCIRLIKKGYRVFEIRE